REPRLDRDHQTRLQLQAAARTPVVGDVRLAVHGAADAVAAELQVDAQPGRPGDVADRGGDVPERVGGTGLLDPGCQCPSGDLDQVEVLLTRCADDDAQRRVGHPAVDV